MRVGVERITKKKWYDRGGFANPALFRQHNGRCWAYYIDLARDFA